jgi:predicted AAA+ superfamily ATPase
MRTEKNIALAEDVLERVREQAQAEGKTADEVVEQAVQRELARKAFERIRREAEIRRGGMTDEEVDRIVEKAVREWRAEQRGW